MEKWLKIPDYPNKSRHPGASFALRSLAADFSTVGSYPTETGNGARNKKLQQENSKQKYKKITRTDLLLS